MFKVLVVDDDESVNMFVSRLLKKKFACNVISALNGLEALNTLKEEGADVIFLDVTMPVMNGMETLEALRSDENLKEIPVIMLTAVSEKSVVAKVMSLGVFDYMLKPLVYEVTVTRIKELFEKIKAYKIETELKKRLKEREAENLYDNRILIADTDDQFVNLLKDKIKEKYDVYTANTGADGLQLFMEKKPATVCIGEGLKIINEKLLAQKIKNFSGNYKVVIFAIKRNPVLDDEDKKVFDHVVDRNKGMQLLVNAINN
ncbi:MAG: response regulator [Melioribacteraceae bacterium]|jgi:DNA-binding response OmpR family regulator|nr:response regulator [Melioribacteraceae bacterium]